MKFMDKDLKAVQEVRVLMEEAAEAKKTLALFEQSKLNRITESMLDAAEQKLKLLTEEAVLETGYGDPEDQLYQAKILIKRLKETLGNMKCVGILESEPDSGMLEIGVPMGVIAAIAPAVSPVSAVICAAACAVKAGNAIVFTPHPRAVKTTVQTVRVLEEGAMGAGLISGALSCAETAAKEGALEMIARPETAMILNMGEPKLLEACNASGCPVLYGGITPGPAFIEKTADIAKAAADIIASRSFNCGTGAGSEQYVVADRQIALKVKEELIHRGAYFMTEKEQEQLTALLGLTALNGNGDREYIGKTASWLAAKAGFSVPEGTKILVSEQSYITDFNPYAKGLMCPVLVFYIEEDWIHACEKCIELLVGESRGNTLTIHSRDPEVIRQFVLKKPVGRVLINTPAVWGAMGVTTNLFPTVVLGSVTSKEGITSENVSPLHMIYKRKAAFGIHGFHP